MQFSSKKMEDFINSVTTDFNKCIDGSTVNDVDLKKNIKQQFRDNCFEYLLRSVYVRYNTPSPKEIIWYMQFLNMPSKRPTDPNRDR